MPNTVTLNKLEEGKTYVICLDNDLYSSSPTLLEVKVFIKLENSIKLMINDEIKWYPTSKRIMIYDEIPIKYLRKEKLEKLENLEE